jgi:hypothetical protein
VLVEGCDNTIAVCASTAIPSSSWNKCTRGVHAFSSATAAMLSTLRPNPACYNSSGNFKSCPCCTNCSTLRDLISNSRSMVPANFSRLEQKFSETQIKQCVETSSRNADSTIGALQRSMQFANKTAQSWYSTLQDSIELRSGLNFAVWVPGWLMIALSLLGLALGSCKGALIVMNTPILQPGGVGQCFHWAAFVCGVLWVSFITLPLFAATSIVSIPLSDLCELIPVSGADPTNLISILSRANVLRGPQHDVDLGDALRHCLLVSNGNFLNSTAASLLLPKPVDSLRIFNRIPNGTIVELLSANIQTAPYIQANGSDTDDPYCLYNFRV